MIEKSICVFGDSISWGAWDFDKGGWVNRLWLYLAKKDDDEYIEVYNCAISGGTTSDILKRFESEAKARNAKFLIFQSGGNDLAYTDVENNFLVTIDKFGENIGKIIKKAKSITDKIIFIDLKNCDEKKTTPVSWENLYYTNKNIKAYSEVMKEICDKNNVLFVNMPHLEDEDFYDGLHPNENGHKKIFDTIRDFLTNVGWI